MGTEDQDHASQEIVDVFRLLEIEKPEDREKVLSLGGYRAPGSSPAYYSIIVSGNACLSSPGDICTTHAKP